MSRQLETMPLLDMRDTMIHQFRKFPLDMAHMLMQCIGNQWQESRQGTDRCCQLLSIEDAP